MVPHMVHLQDVVMLHTSVLGDLGALLLACFGFDLRFALVAFDLGSDLIWSEGVGVGVGARGGSTWAGGDYLRGALGWERRANLRKTNKARSHTHTQAQAIQPLHCGPPTPIPTAFQQPPPPPPSVAAPKPLPPPPTTAGADASLRLAAAATITRGHARRELAGAARLPARAAEPSGDTAVAFGGGGVAAGESAAGAAAPASAGGASAASAAAGASAVGADGGRRRGNSDGPGRSRRPSAAAASPRGRPARGRGPASALPRRLGAEALWPIAAENAANAGKRRWGGSLWSSLDGVFPQPPPSAAAADEGGACHLRAAAGGKGAASPPSGRCRRASRVDVTAGGAVAAPAVDGSTARLRKQPSALPPAGRRAAPDNSGGDGGDSDGDGRGGDGSGESGTVASPDRQRLANSESDAKSVSGALAGGRTSWDRGGTERAPRRPAEGDCRAPPPPPWVPARRRPAAPRRYRSRQRLLLPSPRCPCLHALSRWLCWI